MRMPGGLLAPTRQYLLLRVWRWAPTFHVPSHMIAPVLLHFIKLLLLIVIKHISDLAITVIHDALHLAPSVFH